MSKRARAAAERREFARLFPPGFNLKGEDPKPDPRARLLRDIELWEGLADRGMGKIKYRKLANQAREELQRLEEEETVNYANV